MKPLVHLALIFIGLLLGSVYFLTATALDEMDPVLLLTVRSVLGPIAVLILVRFFRLSLLPQLRRYFWILLVVAASNFIIPWLLVSWGQTRTDSGTAGVLASTSPLFTALLATVLLPNEPLRMRIALGLVVGLAGVALIAGLDVGNLGMTTLLGDLAVVAGALFWALGAILISRLLVHYHEVALVATLGLISAVILLPVAAITHEPSDLALPGHTWLALLVLGLLSGTGLSFPLYTWVIRHAGPIKSSLVFYISPGVAVLLGWGVRGEDLSPYIIGGLILILLSLAWVNEAASRQVV